MLKLKSYSDSGHGWLRVPLKLIRELQAKGHVFTRCSYESKRYAYLEEDIDAGKFLDMTEHVEVKHIYQDRESHIRRLPHLTSGVDFKIGFGGQ